MFRLICLNNVIKRYIYTKLFEPFPQVRWEASKTYPYNLRNGAHFQFYTEFRNLVQKEGAENLKIAPQFEAWLPLYDKEDAVGQAEKWQGRGAAGTAKWNNGGTMKFTLITNQRSTK
jgi:hypothetical protein